MRRSIAIASVIFGLALGGVAPAANPYVNLGPTADFALDQPFVSFTMSVSGTNLGPASDAQTFLLDTGASSIVAVGAAAEDLHNSIGDFNQGVFKEQGVGGFINYFVSAPYEMTIHGTGDQQITISDVKILSDPEQDFGFGAGFYGIVGMPAMVNRVTTLDMTSELGGIDITDLDALIDYLTNGGTGSSVGVGFSNDLPPSNGHRYGVPVSALHFDPEGSVVPTAAPLPLLEVTHRLGCETSTGNYVMDTGAQLSLMSMAKIGELGLDISDAFSFVDIQGVGGIRSVPIFLLDEYRITTSDGVDLVWRDGDPESPGLQVIGLDLHPSLDGVIGSDLLTGGLLNLDEIDLNDIWNLNFELGDNPIEKVQFDFRNLQQSDGSGTGTIFFDLSADIDLIAGPDPVLPADANGDGVIDGIDYQVWEENLFRSGTSCSTGDYNHDGRTDLSDFNIWNGSQPDISCDLNGDFSCTVEDLDMLLGAIGTENPAFDLDGSGGPISTDDRDIWLSQKGYEEIGGPYLLGDVNFDGVVNASDLNQLGQHWTQTSVGSYALGDLDGDQHVNAADLNQLGQNWLATSTVGAAAAVPEPQSIVLGLAALLTALAAWRRQF